MRPRVVLAAKVAFIAAAAAVLVPAAVADDAGDPTAPGNELLGQAPDDAGPADPAEPAPPGLEPSLNPRATVDVDIDGFLAWAARDRVTGQTLTSPNATETSSTESMIKVWIVADHLRRVAAAGDEPSRAELADARRAIRDSSNLAAQRLYAANGYDDVVDRMIERCDLPDTHLDPVNAGWWSRVEISAIDAVRLGECVADGTAAGPEWTDWLLDEMRQVRGSTDPEDQRTDEDVEGGRWGIIDGVPPDLEPTVSIKNGWTRIGRTDSWHLNCLAVTGEWVMAVLMRYPAEYSLAYGADRCARVAAQLLQGEPPIAAP